MAELMTISFILMALTMVISTTISIYVLVKTWPMYRWSMSWFEKAKPMLEELMESAIDSETDK